MSFVDTHLHLWDLSRLPYSWCAGIPTLNRSFLWSDYVAATAGCDIAKAVFMECDVDEPHALDEARQIQALAEAHPMIAGMIASARPERPDFPQQLEALLALPKLRGIRRVLHVVPDDVSQSALFAENLRLLAPHQLTFDVCAQARQLPIIADLVKKCPEVQFIIDHCGVPDVKGRAFDPWRADLAALAALPNTACKISGIVAYADAESWTVADLQPWVDHVIAVFGWDRVVWGGDWPVCTLATSFGGWHQATLDLFQSATQDERDRLFRRNAERIYRV